MSPINRNRVVPFLLAVSLGLFSPIGFGQVQNNGKVMLVLDASGSMWGRVDEREKILIAREVVGDMLDHWDPALSLGLVAYGHRSRGQCSDIETLVPVGGDLEAIRDTVNKLQPRGKTPLSAAVRQAAEHLRFTEDKATVILVSDGRETCDLDPCAVGRSLEQLGVDFTAHVIGFDINEEDRAGLECLASETGGQYFDAQRSDDLRVALDQAVERIKASPDIVVATLGEGGAELSGESLEWRVTGPGGEETRNTGARLELPLDPGGYQVSVVWKDVSGEIGVEVEIGENRRHVIALPVGRVHFEAEAVIAGKRVDQPVVEWSITDADNESERIAFQAAGGPRILPAGRYRALGEFEGQTRGQEFTLAAGENAGVKLVFEIAPATLEAPDSAPEATQIEVGWNGPGGQGDYITAVPPDAGPGSYRNYAYVEKGNPVRVTLPDGAGVYELRYVTGGTPRVLARRPIEVTALEHILAAPDSAPISSPIEVAWQGANGKGDRITVVPPEAKPQQHGKYFYTANGNPGRLVLPDAAGDYELRYVSGQSNVIKVRRPITVTPVAISLDAPESAPMGREVEIIWQGPDGQNDYITVVTPDTADRKHGKYTYTREGSPLRLVMPDSPGQYEIRYVSSQSNSVLARRAVEVTAVTTSLQAPDSAPMARDIEISWQGPDGKNDYITVVTPDTQDRKHGKYTYTREGSPLRLVMPDSPGEYEIRYVSNQSNSVLARRLIRIEEVTVSLKLPAEVAVSREQEIYWTGPDGRNDYITVVTPDTADRKHGKYTYTRQGNPLGLQMPDEPGLYEVRYVSAQSNSVLGRQPVTVTPVAVSLAAPVTTNIGQKVEITWQGPDGRNDTITVVPVSADEKENGKYVYTRNGNPATLAMPDSAGLYELRYISGQSRRVLGRTPVEVSEVAVDLESLSVGATDSKLRIHWQGPAAQGDSIAVAKITDADDRWIRHVRVNRSPLELRLPAEPGTYEIRYVTGQSKRVLARRLLEVVPGDGYLDHMAAMPGGSLRLSAAQAGAPVTDGLNWQVYAVDGRPASIQRSTEPVVEFSLPMGLYRVNLSSSAGSASLDIVLDSGQSVDKTVELP